MVLQPRYRQPGYGEIALGGPIASLACDVLDGPLPDFQSHANARMKRAGRHLLQIFCHALNSAGVTR